MTISLVECKEKESWNQFVKNSPQGTVFCSTLFLDALGEDYDLLLLEDDEGIPQIGTIVIKRDDKPICAPYPDAMYHGILYNESFYKQPFESRVRKGLELTDSLLTLMAEKYDRISFFHHHSIDDLRSFKWFNYHTPEKGRFQIELWYTGIIDLQPFKNFYEYLPVIRKVRRREYRYALKDNLIIEPSEDIDLLNRLNELTFERQGIHRKPEEERLLCSIAKAAIQHKFGQLFIGRTATGEPVSATLFVHDDHCGYYVIGGNDPDFRKSYGGTLIMLENIRYCIDKGIKMVDFGGINSPNRGDFKISFNAKPVSYFITTWNRP